MEVIVRRICPETDAAPHEQTYSVPLPGDGSHTAMDVLDYIHAHLDGTLSYYRHSVCNQGICGRCAARINGKVRLACTCRVYGDALRLEPRNEQVVKDLVVK